MSLPELPSLSVVIVTYARSSFLARCLESLNAESADIKEVVVVDASAEDDSATAVNSYPGVVYVHAPELAGHMTRSRNRALLHLTGDVVSFLDDDVVVHRGWAAAVRHAFQEESIDGLAGRTLNGQAGEDQPSEPIGTLRRDGRLTAEFAASTPSRVPVTHGIGANMSFTRNILHRLGGFRDDYPGTAMREDTDIFLRISRLGGRVMFDPEAAVDHLPAPHVHGRRFDTRYKLYGRRNHVVLLARHTGWLSPMMVRWVGSQYSAVLHAPGIRRKAERLGVTTLGILWGAVAAGRQARPTPLAPERSGSQADLIREALSGPE